MMIHVSHFVPRENQWSSWFRAIVNTINHYIISCDKLNEYMCWGAQRCTPTHSRHMQLLLCFLFINRIALRHNFFFVNLNSNEWMNIYVQNFKRCSCLIVISAQQAGLYKKNCICKMYIVTVDDTRKKNQQNLTCKKYSTTPSLHSLVNVYFVTVQLKSSHSKFNTFATM